MHKDASSRNKYIKIHPLIMSMYREMKKTNFIMFYNVVLRTPPSYKHILGLLY